ncbi:unnamed protein product [Prorocentrum cordatum]|uniref:Ubiquitinyl hydrolase 1 n=1 Tax=Prorocentrum cordatum TaxID=2364126 RepID=A0ABN9WPD9_9DINO|nr:unnamed protein product [Polarella glacialis]
MAPRPEGPLWSLFVEYPLCDAIFDDQRLVIEDLLHGGGARSVVSVDQLFDGAFLRVVVPRRRIFVSLQGADAPERAVAWFPGSEAEQIESAIARACGLPPGTAVELLDGDAAVVISPTIPNDSVLKNPMTDQEA